MFEKHRYSYSYKQFLESFQLKLTNFIYLWHQYFEDTCIQNDFKNTAFMWEKDFKQNKNKWTKKKKKKESEIVQLLGLCFSPQNVLNFFLFVWFTHDRNARMMGDFI